MINSELIIKYTDALYSTPAESAPRYDEFRDMFSSGQIRSKEWLITELDKVVLNWNPLSMIIAGAWFGTLGMMLHKHFCNARITMMDIDPRCAEFIHHMIYKDNALKSITADMYEYRYTEDVIINTSCEHIPDIHQWLALLPPKRTVVLQSNNFYNGSGHVNCTDTIGGFIEQTGITDILYSGELEMPMYTRYMIIGKI